MHDLPAFALSVAMQHFIASRCQLPEGTAHSSAAIAVGQAAVHAVVALLLLLRDAVIARDSILGNCYINQAHTAASV